MKIEYFYIAFRVNKWYNITIIAYWNMLNKSRRNFYEF